MQTTVERSAPSPLFRTLTRRGAGAAGTLLLLFWAAGCARKPVVKPTPPSPKPRIQVRTGFAVQVGAFRRLENAVRLAASLKEFGIDAYYFKHDSGLFKVRFGDYTDHNSARDQAERFRRQGIFQEYFIVSPKLLAVEKQTVKGKPFVREAIVQQAESYLGIPYRWGGTTAENGFDCSGLTSAVYSLVGLKLPRTSRAQFASGTPVRRSDLRKGDLVFFRTSGSSRVSHVGIFTGSDLFIHAPGKDRSIRRDSLNSDYFERRYAGARSYLR